MLYICSVQMGVEEAKEMKEMKGLAMAQSLGSLQGPRESPEYFSSRIADTVSLMAMSQFLMISKKSAGLLKRFSVFLCSRVSLWSTRITWDNQRCPLKLLIQIEVTNRLTNTFGLDACEVEKGKRKPTTGWCLSQLLRTDWYPKNLAFLFHLRNSSPAMWGVLRFGGLKMWRKKLKLGHN